MNIGSIIDKVNSTRLKHGVDILSSFHTRHTKSNNLEKVVNWLNSELQKACKDNQVFFRTIPKSIKTKLFILKISSAKSQA